MDKRGKPLAAIFKQSWLRRKKKKQRECRIYVPAPGETSLWCPGPHTEKMKQESEDCLLRAAKLAEPGLIGHTEYSVGSSTKDWPGATVHRAESPPGLEGDCQS